MVDMIALNSWRETLVDRAVDTVLVCFPDMQGRLVGKRMQAQFFSSDAYKEIHCCDYLLTTDINMEPVPGYRAANWNQGYGDLVVRPDLSTLRVLAWSPGTALVIGDAFDHEGHPLAHSPRAILKAQIERLKKLGLAAFAASELEFYLFDQDYRTLHAQRYQNAETAGRYVQDYQPFYTQNGEEVLRALRNGLQGSGIPVENSKGEWGPGQEEINLRYADALGMADCHIIVKSACKEIAFQKGRAVTFMAKWRPDLAGSSCHIHMSLRDAATDAPRFHDPEDKLGMSMLMKHFLAGQLKYASETALLLAPYVNSYKRFQAGTFAPTKIAWSVDNRTAGFRICAPGSKDVRIECRIGGADLNPYLAYAALIAAGIRGVEEKLVLPSAPGGNIYFQKDQPDIPSTLRDAISAFESSEMLRSALGCAVVEHYAHAARWEQSEYDRSVTDWELMRGFERY